MSSTPASTSALPLPHTSPTLCDPLPLTADQQQQLATHLSQQFSQWKQARQGLENKWGECWQAYLCELNPLSTDAYNEGPDRSRVSRPVLYEAVEGIQSNLMNALFPSDERFFSVVGKTEKDHANASTIENFLRTKLEATGFSEKFAMFLKQALITGNTVAAVPWQQRWRTRRVKQPVEVFGMPIHQRTTTQQQLVFHGPEFDVIDMFDFVMDPDADRFENATVIHRVTRPLAYLKQHKQTYHNTDNIQIDSANEDDTEGHKRARKSAFGLNNTEKKATQQDVTLLEVWGDFKLNDGTTYTNYVCVIANGQHVLRFEPNPYDHGMKPFVFTNLIPVPNEIYGIGAIEKSLGLQHAINTLTNQKLDLINLSINSPFTYLINDDVFDPASIVTRPGALIPVKSHETLKPLQYLNDFTIAFTEIADLKSEIQEATGALNLFNGVAQPRQHKKTATEIDALITGGAQKFNTLISHLENTALEPFLEMVFENAKQFLTEPHTLRLSKHDGSLEFVELLPEVLQQSQCQFRIDGSQAASLKNQELETLIGFIQLVQQAPELKSHINIIPLLKKIYRRLGFKDEDSIFTTPPTHKNTT